MSEHRSKPRKQPKPQPPLPFSSTTSSSPPTSPKRPHLSLTLKSLLLPHRMLRPALLATALLMALVLLLTTSTSLLPDRHYLLPSRSFSSSRTIRSAAAARIYVYDLPRKFTYGVVESYLLARDPGRAEGIPDSELRYPGHQHSAEWWLFSDLNREDRGPSPVVRVSDPEEADLFYVPFFSSLSLVVNPIRPVGAAGAETESVYSDEEMQEELVRWLEGQEHWRRNEGRDHVFICQDPNALYKVVDTVKNGVLLVSDFGRLKGDQASLVKDVILPYSHRINSFKGDVGVDGRISLLFFMGNRYRKEGGKIRDTLFQVLDGQKDVIIKHGTQSRESRRMARQGMHSSKFCLHPAGDTPSACRLFDAIVSMCIPVIISDYIELPFEDVIDYKKIAIFVDTEKAVEPGFLIKMLKSVSTERILQYQNDIKAVRHYFEYEDPNGTVNEIWRQVSLKVPLIKLMSNRNKRFVRRESGSLDCSCICSARNETVSLHHEYQ